VLKALGGTVALGVAVHFVLALLLAGSRRPHTGIAL